MSASDDLRQLADEILNNDPDRFVNFRWLPVSKIRPSSVLDTLRKSTLADLILPQDAVFMADNRPVPHPIGLLASDALLSGVGIYVWEATNTPRDGRWAREVSLRFQYGRTKGQSESTQNIVAYVSETNPEVEMSRFVVTSPYLKTGGYMGHARVARPAKGDETAIFIRIVRYLHEKGVDDAGRSG